MAIDLIPAGTLIAQVIIAEPVLIVAKVWQPHAPPKKIGPGELDAVTTATDRIYWHWQPGPNWQTLVGIIGIAAQSVVAEQFQISEYRYLETGFGQILDELGAMVGLDRQGLGEELYRLAIRVRGASMISDAGIDSVTTPVKQLLGDDAVTYVPTYPASFMWVITIAISPDMLALLLELLPPLIGAGIGAALLLASLDTPGWDSLTPQVWAASWSSSIGAVDDNVAAAWTVAVQVG